MTQPSVRGPDLWLSHALSEQTPAYGNGEGFSRTAASRIATGGSANSDFWRLPNHLGTHVDAPRHFDEGGSTVESYGIKEWWFSTPIIIDIPKGDDGLVVPADVDGRVPSGTDFLMLRTGFERYRGEPRYWERNPGLTESLGRWIRRTHPSIRAVGIDLISVTARAHRVEGRLAHRAFLTSPEGVGAPVLLIEDMALAHVKAPLSGVLLAPLRVNQGDGAPVTILGWTR